MHSKFKDQSYEDILKVLTKIENSQQDIQEQLDDIMEIINSNDSEFIQDDYIFDENQKEKLSKVFTGFITCSNKGYNLEDKNKYLIIKDKKQLIDLIFYNKKHDLHLLVKFTNNKIDDDERKIMFKCIKAFDNEKNIDNIEKTIGMIIYAGDKDASIAYIGYNNINMDDLFDQNDLISILNEAYNSDTNDDE